jgi:hypothetical protein
LYLGHNARKTILSVDIRGYPWINPYPYFLIRYP